MRHRNQQAMGLAARLTAAAVFISLGGCGSGGGSSPVAPSTQVLVTCTASTAQASPNQAIQFTCTPSGGNGTFAFAWDFADGQTSTQQNPAHAFQTIGNFGVKVTVSSGGQTASSTLTVRVGVNQALVVGPDGGWAGLNFAIAAPGRVRISLSAPSNLAPYSSLEGPGFNDYFPILATASGGANSGELSLPQAGTFALIVFEGNNLGGNISVRVEVI